MMLRHIRRAVAIQALEPASRIDRSCWLLLRLCLGGPAAFDSWRIMIQSRRLPDCCPLGPGVPASKLSVCSDRQRWRPQGIRAETVSAETVWLETRELFGELFGGCGAPAAASRLGDRSNRGSGSESCRQARVAPLAHAFLVAGPCPSGCPFPLRVWRLGGGARNARAASRPSAPGPP